MRRSIKSNVCAVRVIEIWEPHCARRVADDGVLLFFLFSFLVSYFFGFRDSLFRFVSFRSVEKLQMKTHLRIRVTSGTVVKLLVSDATLVFSRDIHLPSILYRYEICTFPMQFTKREMHHRFPTVYPCMYVCMYVQQKWDMFVTILRTRTHLCNNLKRTTTKINSPRLYEKK